ncbi:hypothetical protein HRbin16_03236 [bacterium HR16]|nr:hypothetical protein HRbin16_03236 [bacterium HR16]
MQGLFAVRGFPHHWREPLDGDAERDLRVGVALYETYAHHRIIADLPRAVGAESGEEYLLCLRLDTSGDKCTVRMEKYIADHPVAFLQAKAGVAVALAQRDTA